MFPNSLHDRTFFLLHIPHPIRLPRRDEQVAIPALDLAVELVVLVDGEFAGIVDGAARAVVEAFVAVYGGIGGGEEGGGGGGGLEAIGAGFEGGGGVAGFGEGGQAVEEGGHFPGHLIGDLSGGQLGGGDLGVI